VDEQERQQMKIEYFTM